jgi:hypothetical protein
MVDVPQPPCHGDSCSSRSNTKMDESTKYKPVYTISNNNKIDTTTTATTAIQNILQQSEGTTTASQWYTIHCTN